ncbi:MAG: acetyl-CoA hydrolase/transferase family protein [Chloroflexi bacterium]|nr:acetyl-CoA hydrolase/transferase family protein [Chloroflexota bacterium]
MGEYGPRPTTAPRTVSPAEAAAVVQSGQRVFVQGGCATPVALVEALAARGQELSGVEVVHIHTEGPAHHVAPELTCHLRHRAFFIGPNVRAAISEGRADYAPVFLSDIPALFRSGQMPIDVALLHLSPPDAHGYCSFGLSVDCSKAAAECARLVIAQTNRRMPRTLGDSFLHLSQIDYLVPVDTPPLTIAPEPLDEVALQIGRCVAELVEDGATLQMGIGAIPNAVLAALRDKSDLGIHTEMFSDGVLDLVEAGVVTGARKTLDSRKIVAAFLMGSQRLYDFVHDNPAVEMRPVEYTNDTRIIRQHDKMTAINSAIQIDLTGQVCAESIGLRLYSGVGGQMDFLRGAALAPGGKPIVALRSTALGGKASRIVPTLPPGAGVTTTRAHVHYVVTEHGVANLHGLSLRERAARLIDLAHPDFRPELRAFARKHLGYGVT